MNSNDKTDSPPPPAPRDPIADYYRRCAEQQAAAYARYKAAKDDPTTQMAKLQQLKEEWISAGNTGD